MLIFLDEVEPFDLADLLFDISNPSKRSFFKRRRTTGASLCLCYFSFCGHYIKTNYETIHFTEVDG